MRSIWLNVCCLVFLASIASPALAQSHDWLTAALPERSFDFGVVARGSLLRHAFPIVNNGDREIRILNWQTKCGCSEVKVGSKTIPPGTQTTIEVTVDTTRFEGQKPSGLTLVFEAPSYVQIDLNTNCFIRSDITTSPGLLDFGIVRRSPDSPKSSLTLTYAGGRPDWQVLRMQTRTDRVKAELAETGRTQDGRIQYSLTAILAADAPNGSIKDEVTLETNDGERIPIAIVANIQSAVALTPSVINFGQVRPGETVSRTVLVRSSKPFSITNLSTTRSELQSDDSSGAAQALHQVKLTLTAPNDPGPFHSLMTVQTDIPDEPEAVLKAFATVGP